ncbi:pyridoxamine 5'-phosphate oxidase family protein [Tissierella sp. MB52-C2]|uniref:pyridoxamine 5'-phosphate oxidase family protein n=1 Tax=Tissierella sp. MB52-C2 TaxID=3070999 RepID=UPI00280A947F|nr:pyridoxamine 5'-phosphate oxidase family protein [Tissierella sp. MB52-C2]WMM24634.1 pyridoxamine 5'-phosphate oxidase family protein [Tissierella sp. MB52-C2]
MSKEIIKKAGEIIRQNTAHNSLVGSEPYCVLALIDKDGHPTASTITASKSDGINWLTFCTGLKSNKVKRIENCNRASLCFNKDGAYNITLVGTIEIVTDIAVKEEMWYPGMGQHFKGSNDLEYCVLRFKTNRYNLLVDWQEVEGVL